MEPYSTHRRIRDAGMYLLDFPVKKRRCKKERHHEFPPMKKKTLSAKQLTKDSSKGHRNYIILLCDVLLFFAMLFWLPLDPEVSKGLAILAFIAVLWLTEAVHVTITALMVPVLAMMLGILPGKSAMVGFSDPIIFLFFGGFALAGALHEQKIDSWLAGKILRFSKGKLWLALGLIFMATAFLSMWMSNTATAAMMLPLVIGLMSEVDGEKYKTTWIFAVLGVAYSASIGGMGTLVGSPPNAIAAHELGMGFYDWFLVGFPVACVFGVVVFAVMWLMLRPKLTLNIQADKEISAAGREAGRDKLDGKQKRVLGLFTLIAICWMCSSFISGLLGDFAEMDAMIALCAVVLLAVSGVINWTAIVKNTDWGVLLLFGGGITLSSVLMKTGAGHFLAAQMTELSAGHSTFFFLLIVSAFISLLTEFCSNTASAALVAPLMVTVAAEMGIPAEPLVLLIGIGASCAFMLPVSTPPNAIAYASGKVPQSAMIRIGLTVDLVLIVIKAGWAYLFWM